VIANASRAEFDAPDASWSSGSGRAMRHRHRFRRATEVPMTARHQGPSRQTAGCAEAINGEDVAALDDPHASDRGKRQLAMIAGHHDRERCLLE
jgi:hypothetical protein